MRTFTWRAKTRIGELRTGEMEAESADVVEARLRAQQLQVLKIRKKAKEYHIRLPGNTGIESREIMVFTRQFSTMVDAGLPMVQCLEILGTQTENPEFRRIIVDVKNTVEAGSTLSNSLARHPLVFGRFYTNLVDAGETGGILDKILHRLADYIEKADKINKQIKRAFLYPALVMVVAFFVTLVLLIWVIPVFQNMFANFGEDLPGPTQLVVFLSESTREYVHLILGGVFGLAFFAYYAYSSKRGRLIIDEFLLDAPGVGPLVQKMAVARFSRTLGTMLSSGVPILEALDIVAVVAGNRVIENGLLSVRDKISEGKSMSAPLSEIKAFPPMVVQMITVGESTGALDTMLDKIADFYDEEVDHAVGGMMAVLGPAIMAVLAVVLGGLVIAMYLPVFQLAGAIS